ncbi:MAG: nucleotide sugar dehydrogenase [Pseudomonadales bacterium]|jgi:GDP-mannose 6-dehydrogenase|nr:nucleotide sugar dehydrogenase [Pseudomonadales bacterium]
MRIGVYGLGYVGAVSLACLARDGHEVIGVDIDPVKLDILRRGESPVIEAGMPELVREVMARGSVQLTDDAGQALSRTDVSLICVGTPSQPNGSQDQSAVMRLTEELGRQLGSHAEHHTLVYRSTLVPGTVERSLIPLLEETSGRRVQADFDVCFQPEFLREGSSIRDYDQPPFTIVGAATERAHETLRSLFGHLPCEYHRCDISTAEAVKYFCNIFHALKITFANEVGRVCDAMHVDPHQVMRLLCEDRQLNISPAYMKPGFAFGGSCLPKDLRAMLYLAKMNDVDVPMLSGVLESNRAHLRSAAQRILALGKRRIGMIGLSFKTGTDDLRESALVDLAETLIGKGMDLSIYDPAVNLSLLIGANKRYIERTIPHLGDLLRDDLEELVDGSEVIVVGGASTEALGVLEARVRPEQVVVDLMMVHNRDRLSCHYLGGCWS